MSNTGCEAFKEQNQRALFHLSATKTVLKDVESFEKQTPVNLSNFQYVILIYRQVY